MADRIVVAVDIGTHTVLATAARRRGTSLEILADRQWFARLGEGVRATGRLRAEAIERAVAALRDVRAMADESGAAEIAAVGTRACREARNAEEFLRAAGEVLGVRVEVVTGEREAELTFRGAASGLDVVGQATYVDVGGGSTEVIDAEGEEMRGVVSMPLGAVALTEAHLRSDPYTIGELEAMRAAVRSECRRAGIPLRSTVVGIGGTATTFAAVDRALEPYDGDSVHGTRISRTTLLRRAGELAAMTADARRAVPGLHPDRAPVIVAGGAVLAEILDAAGAPEMIVSDRGVRHGLLLDRLGATD